MVDILAAVRKFPHPMFRRDALAAWLHHHPKTLMAASEDVIRDESDLYPRDVFGSHQVHNDMRVLEGEGRI